jgi:Flp pilus assembly protein TadG
MTMTRRPSLSQDRRGVATIEFALLSCFFFAVVLAVLDYGMFFIQRGNLGAGVATASIHSFANRASVTFDAIPAMVTANAGAPAASGLVVAVRCNGGAAPCTNTSRQCACLTSANTYVAAATCGEPCSGTSMIADSTSGYYLGIDASYRYAPIVLPRSAIRDTALTQTAVVRLQ